MKKKKVKKKKAQTIDNRIKNKEKIVQDWIEIQSKSPLCNWKK